MLAAIGLSIAGWVPVATLLTNWFERRRALVFGVLGAGFGLSLIAAYSTQYIILSLGWRTAYLVIGVCVALLIPPACVHFIRRTPAEKGLFPDGISAAEAEVQPAQAADGERSPTVTPHAWTLEEALRARQFWLLFLIWVCTMGIVEQTVISQQVYFYLDAGYSPLTASSFYGVFGIALAAGNLLGSFSDRMGRDRFALPSFVLCLVFTGLLFLIRDASSPWLPLIFAVGFGTCFGLLSCVLNATVADIFHGPHYGRIAGCHRHGIRRRRLCQPMACGVSVRPLGRPHVDLPRGRSCAARLHHHVPNGGAPPAAAGAPPHLRVADSAGLPWFPEKGYSMAIRGHVTPKRRDRRNR